MQVYRPVRVRPFRVLAWSLRGIAKVIALWPLWLFAALLLSPVGPHLRWQYSGKIPGTDGPVSSCLYLGVRGFVPQARRGACPFFVLIDRRKAH